MEKPQSALQGVMMELDDCAFPLLEGMVGTGDPNVAFKDADLRLDQASRARDRLLWSFWHLSFAGRRMIPQRNQWLSARAS